MKDKSLRGKLLFLSFMLLGLSVLVGVTGFVGTTLVAKAYKQIPDDNMPNVIAVNRYMLEIRRARINVLNLVSKGVTPALITKSYAGIETAEKDYKKADEEYLATPFANKEEEDTYAEFSKHSKDYFALIDKMVELNHKADGHDESAEFKELLELAMGSLPKLGDDMRESFKKLETFHMNFAQENVNKAQLAERISFWLMLTMIVGGFAGGYLYARKFSDELVASITKVSHALNEASGQVSSASTQIAASSQELSSSTTQQASSLAETAASIEEMNSMVAKNNENSAGAARVSQESEETAIRGQRGVENMIASMNEIAQSNEQVTQIVKVIREIGEKTKVINDIVFQTKLLSFNASVEAARAGEHGKGFAVVAEEVGNLAQMSGNAAKEITNLLESSIQKVEAIVVETKRKVEAGTLTARECGEILSEIVKNVGRVSVMAGDISTASSEQSTGVGEITKAMNQLDQVTQQNAATSAESASAAEELSAQAESLSQLVGELVAVVTGGGAEGAVLAPPSIAKSAAKIKSPVRAAAAPPKESDQDGKVLPFRKKEKSVRASVQTLTVKKAVGDDSAPSFDDSRFEDV